MVMSRVEINKKIRIRLAELNKNKEWLAEQIGMSGSNLRTTLANFEKGKNVNFGTLEKIANALNIELKSLV